MSATGTNARPKNEQKSDLSRALAPEAGRAALKCLMTACFR